MSESRVSEPNTERQGRRPPPWAPWLLGLALPIAVILELLALISAAVVFPLFDLAPLFVLLVALLSYRWAGVSKKWLTASSVLAAVMLVEWIAWDVWYYVVVFGGSISTYGFDQLVRRFGNPLVALLLVEIVALLVVFGRACVLSYKGVKKTISQG